MSVVSYQLSGQVGVITLNNPPVNALSQALRSGILDAVASAQGDASQAIILYCEGKTFIAGADITEFGKPPRAPVLAEVLAAIEQSAKPVIAAIHGTALGGGLELAMACHYRCALASAKLGLPEVNLGLLPGGGGTQRLPRLIGVEAALEMILRGKPIEATKAETGGLLDRVFDEALLDHAMAYARSLIAQGVGKGTQPPRRTGEQPVDTRELAVDIFDKAREQVAKRFRGYLSPGLIVEALEVATHVPFAEGLKRERELFTRCVASPQSQALRYQFFAEREAAKITGFNPHTPEREIRRVAVIGAGTMGTGIAMCFANAGLPVTLLEVQAENLERGLATVRKNYQASMKKGALTDAQVQARLALIQGTLSYEDLASVDLVVEAVFESLEVKRRVFESLDRVCKPGAILATNTSYLDVNKIAAFTQRPRDVIGMHFFSPAQVMKLLEVVRTDHCSDEVIATVMKLGRRLPKICTLVGVCYGFVGNRLFTAYCREAQMLLLEGATPQQVDKAMVDWGMAMGPLSVLDLAGLDIGYKARQSRDDLPDDRRYFHIGNVLVEQGRLGRKTGAGFYVYDADTHKRCVDPEVELLIRAEAERLGIQQREIDSAEIVERLIYALVNEAAKLLEEGIAQRPSDVDVILVNGYGFPRYRGGPLHYAETIGLDKVCDRIEAICAQMGELYWRPAPLLQRLAREGRGFKDVVVKYDAVELPGEGD